MRGTARRTLLGAARISRKIGCDENYAMSQLVEKKIANAHSSFRLAPSPAGPGLRIETGGTRLERNAGRLLRRLLAYATGSPFLRRFANRQRTTELLPQVSGKVGHHAQAFGNRRGHLAAGERQLRVQ